MAKTALITGGSKGIGYAIAEALVKEGINVCITARHEADLIEASKRLNALGKAKVLGLVCNVRYLEEQEKAVKEILEQFGNLDILIANAGVGHFAPIDEMTSEQWNDVIDINLTGVFYSVKASVEALKKSKGYIITVSSLAGTNFFAQGAAYNASKFGLTGMSQAMMLDLRKYGIKVSTIMPGTVATYFAGHEPNEKDAWKIQPEDIAEMVVYLLNAPARTLPSKIEVRPSQPA
jgi:NAD(P)-dependent dehydrogenase (short-subunit alcohol dehydrogenase family)